MNPEQLKILGSSFLGDLLKSVNLFYPETALVVTFLLAILVDLFTRNRPSCKMSGYVSLIGFFVTAIFLCNSPQGMSFAGTYAVDAFSIFFKWIVLITSFVIIVFSFFSKELFGEERQMGEYYTLIVGMTFGMFLLSGATNLILIYLAIETMSMSSYILAGYTKEIKRASEASLKYVIYGATSSGIMIYGISLLFGLTGSLNLSGINAYLAGNNVNHITLLISGIMIIAGIGYKISAVPFHFWTPDVYEGAPVTITAYLSVASKAAGFAILIRLLNSAFTIHAAGDTINTAWSVMKNVDWTMIIAVLSVLSMTLGNFVAVWQTNVKRLLAYSSIAHAGYILMGVAVMNYTGVSAIMIYLAIYMFMNLGAFFVVMIIANHIDSEDLEDYQGIGYRSPWLGVAMTIFMVSLTGLPPTAGFIGKLYVFTAVLNSGMYWLAVIGVLNSVVSLYYYVKVFRNMFLRGAEKANQPIELSLTVKVILIALIIPNIALGIWFGGLVNWANASAAMILK
jgi:NADH-quinone oxidoreductase subunit N